MARRRFQDPRPRRRGKWWTIQVRRDEFVGGRLQRRKTRVRIAPATVPEREARKIAAEYLRPQNQGLELIFEWSRNVGAAAAAGIEPRDCAARVPIKFRNSQPALKGGHG